MGRVFLAASLLMFVAVGCSPDHPIATMQDNVPGTIESAKPNLGSADAIATNPAAKGRDELPGPVKEPPGLLTAEELAAGWVALFDGQTLFGWKAHSQADWRVEEGAIAVGKGEKGLLCTPVQFSDFELLVDFRAAAGTNSGVFLRTAPVTGPDDVTTKCYELNIAPPSNPFPTGSFVGRKKVEGAGESDAWRTFHVTLVGGKAEVKLDGKTVLEYDDPAPIGRGYIGLQLNEGAVAFRNIKLRPLGLAPLLNGKDLSGWKDHPMSKSKFAVTEQGELNVKDGRGCLESEQAFGDFALQYECRTHAPNLNGGIFFRSIPGELMNGYEMQVHNGFKDGDRQKPVDHGSGGIFRRAPARLVVANDDEWFHAALVADGPRMAAWINGYPVTAWVDERKPDANPRNGLRLEAGTLQIQGHDPTTNISFRNLRAVELAK